MADRTKNTGMAYFLIFLMLSGHGLAMRARVDHHTQTAKLEAKVFSDNDMQEALRRGEAAIEETSCEDLPNVMRVVLQNATSSLEQQDWSSEIPEHAIQVVGMHALMITTVANVADTKFCLPEVMADPAVQQAVANLENVWGAVTAHLRSEEAQARVERSTVLLNEWKTQLQALSGSMLDRSLLFPSNVEENCPEPCTSCSTESGLFHRVDKFEFRCTLESSSSALPVAPGLTCEAPSGWGRTATCTVKDWQSLASQRTRIMAYTICDSRAVLAPIHNGGEVPQALRETCLEMEKGKAVSQEDMDEYRDFLTDTDDVVPAAFKAAFAIKMSLSITAGISELRQASRGNSAYAAPEQAHSSLMESDSATGVGCDAGDRGVNLFAEVGKVLVALVGGVMVGTALAVFGTSAVIFLMLFGFIIDLVMWEAVGGGFNVVRAMWNNPQLWLASAVVFGVSVGLYVAGSLYRSMSGTSRPFDCQPGTVTSGGSTFCVGGLHYGRRRSFACPGGSQLEVRCAQEDWGALTKANECGAMGPPMHTRPAQNPCQFQQDALQQCMATGGDCSFFLNAYQQCSR